MTLSRDRAGLENSYNNSKMELRHCQDVIKNPREPGEREEGRVGGRRPRASRGTRENDQKLFNELYGRTRLTMRCVTGARTGRL